MSPKPDLDDFGREIEWPDPDPRDSKLFHENWARKILKFKVRIYLEKRHGLLGHPETEVIDLDSPTQWEPLDGWRVTQIEFLEVDDGS